VTRQQLIAEFVGTMMLLATVVGSGIMGEALSGGNDGLALWGNTAATGAILVVLILIFGPISGAHFNPAVTLVFLAKGEIDRKKAAFYIVMQIVGAIVGVLLAHAMFDLELVQASVKVRNSSGQWLSEAVATFGLLIAILGCVRARPDAVPYAVGLYITAGYWFTASTSFANPAVTIARSMTNSFSGILGADVPYFIAFQLLGAFLALWLFRQFDAPKVDV
jgi:glycerol uptake facilitator-like aquaporin